VGGDNADELTATRLREAIVAAVRSGELTEARLRDAAERVERLAGWTMRTQNAVGARAVADAAGSRAAGSREIVEAVADPAGAGVREVAVIGGSAVGLAAARRAVKVTAGAAAPTLPLTRAPHVVEFAPPHNLAIGAETPWGVGGPLGDLLPGTSSVRLSAEDLAGLSDPAVAVLAGVAGRPLVLVVRDAHRHPWIAEALASTLTVRPDAIVVEMGVPVVISGGLHIATHGATRSCGQAAAEVIAGTSVPAPHSMAA